MDSKLVELAASLGVGGILALGMFLVHRKDMKEQIERWRGQSDILVSVVKDNTAAITKLIDKLDHFMERDR